MCTCSRKCELQDILTLLLFQLGLTRSAWKHERIPARACILTDTVRGNQGVVKDNNEVPNDVYMYLCND
jgi:hypothetical protein